MIYFIQRKPALLVSEQGRSIFYILFITTP